MTPKTTKTTKTTPLIQSLTVVGLTVLSLLAMAPGLSAQQQRGGGADQPPPGRQQGEQGRGKRPPREAIEACAQKQAGDACQFQGRRGEQLKGKCWAPSKQHVLACLPEGHRPPPPRDGQQCQHGHDGHPDQGQQHGPTVR